MTHATPLITLLVAGIGLAFVLGLLARRLRLPMIAGYLVAGIMIGPFTPGYVANQALAGELAEIGVILLMFGVGLHFSPRDLLSVRAIAVPGALAQITLATAAGSALGWFAGWGLGAGLLFGLALSVASTVVLLRALDDRGLIATERGRIAVGWLIVEDMAMVLALVLIPPLAGLMGGRPVEVDGGAEHVAALGLSPILSVVLVTLAKAAAFIALMLLVGRRVIPALLQSVARSQSDELFRLAVLATALGVAYGSALLFGVSFALGAFFAGMVMAGSPFSQQAMDETLPLRDAFAVLFFVSVGMLFDPAIVLRAPFGLLGTLLVIVGVKSVAAYAIVRMFGHDRTVALTIAAALAQIGEFSFILMAMGVALGIVPQDAKDLAVAGAMLSILLNPLVFRLAERFGPASALPDLPQEPQRHPG